MLAFSSLLLDAGSVLAHLPSGSSEQQYAETDLDQLREVAVALGLKVVADLALMRAGS